MLHLISQNILAVFYFLLQARCQFLFQSLLDGSLVLSASLLRLLNYFVSAIVVNSDLIMQFKFGFSRGARDASLVNADYSLRLDDLVVVIVQGLLHGLESAKNLLNGLAQRHRDVFPLARLHVLHEVVDGQERVIGTFRVPWIESHAHVFCFSRCLGNEDLL